jgi:hypothetical protein
MLRIVVVGRVLKIRNKNEAIRGGREDGRLVGTRTPDLHRVKVAL